MSQKLTSLQAKAGGRRRGDDARSEARTIYGDNIDQSDKRSSLKKQKKRKSGNNQSNME